MKSDVDLYLDKQPPKARTRLKRVRTIAKQVLGKGAEDAISYGIPAVKLDGRVVLYYSAWKDHYSLYPVNKRMLTLLGADVSKLDVNDKGTWKLGYDDTMPTHLIQRIVKLRAQENAARKAVVSGKKKKATKKAPKKKARSK